MRARKRAIAQANARTQNSFERITGQIHGLLEQMKQSPDNEALVHQYLDLLDSPDALTGLDSSYRQGAKVKGAELLEDIRKNQRNRQLFLQYQDECDAIMATYNENPVVGQTCYLNYLQALPLLPFPDEESQV